MPGGGSKAYNRAGSGGGGSGSRAAEQADDICRGTSRGGAHVDPACMPGQMSLKGASRDPQLIRAQLKRAGEYFRQSLQELNAGGSLAADPAGHSALEGYKLIRFAQHGIENRLARDKNPPPSLKQYIARIEEARKHNRMAMTALKQATQALGGPDVRLAMQQKNAMSQRTSSGKGKRRNDVGTISPEAEQRAQQKASELVASAMDHLQRTAVITQEVLAKLQ
jgi:hypothetical protein